MTSGQHREHIGQADEPQADPGYPRRAAIITAMSSGGGALGGLAGILIMRGGDYSAAEYVYFGLIFLGTALICTALGYAFDVGLHRHYVNYRKRVAERMAAAGRDGRQEG